MDDFPSESMARCPVTGGARTHIYGLDANRKWFPNALDLTILKQNTPETDPNDPDFDYAEAFKTLDIDAVWADLEALMTDSQEWWPADYGHYGPFMVRMAWHSAGTYRIGDGRGGAGMGMQRFAPTNSWPDNGNLDKARRLLWPIKQKYGAKISWADLMILTGNVALESMGFKTYGFSGGRADVYEPDQTYWGPETEWLGNQRYTGDRVLEAPLAAVQMGLIYVNPEGPDGNPDPMGSARDIRETFARMAMNDEETVALVAGGHAFGKTHGAAPESHLGAMPEEGNVESQGLGYTSSYGTGMGKDAITSGFEGAWTENPTKWDNNYLENLFKYDWECVKGPGGHWQWEPRNPEARGTVPDAHDPALRHAPMMLTSDIALRIDPIYHDISKRFLENPEQLADAFAKAWYKLTHRDMGPHVRGLGKLKPTAEMIWQDPVPAVDHPLIDASDIADLKSSLLASGLSVPQLVSVAWASASTYRESDKRGGANGARIRLAPQKDWAVNEPAKLASVLSTLESIKSDFDATQSGGKAVSMADLIVLAGVAGVEKAAKDAGFDVTVPFNSGRTDATDEMTDGPSFAPLEPVIDGFRNYSGGKPYRNVAEHLVDRANLLSLTAPEMTVLVGGLRVLGANTDGVKHGVFTDRVGTLTNDFFVNLLDMGTVWSTSDEVNYEGRGRKDGALRYTATAVDLVFGSNSQLRSIAEVYGSSDSGAKFARDFAAAFGKVMELDRFDLR